MVMEWVALGGRGASSIGLGHLFFFLKNMSSFLFFFAGAADFKPGTTVQKYTTEIFVQKKSRVVLDCSIRTQSHDMLYSWTKDGQELVSQKQRLKDGQDIIPQRRRHNWDLKSQGRISLAENGSLIIERVINKKKKGLSDEGFYECIGESTLGTVIGRRVIIKIESKYSALSQQLTLCTGLSNFSIFMLGLRTTFIMEDNGFKISVYNLRYG